MKAQPGPGRDRPVSRHQAFVIVLARAGDWQRGAALFFHARIERIIELVRIEP